MAIWYRPDRRAPYLVYWRNPVTGKRESSAYVTREEAEKENARILYRLKYERDSFEENEPAGGLTLAGCHLAYMREKAFGMAGLRWQRDCMREALDLWGDTPVQDITTAMLGTFKAALLARHRTAATARAHLSVLRTVLRWAVRQGYRDALVFPPMPVVHYRRIVPPTEDELAAMLAVAPPHIRRVIILGSKTGVRIGNSELFRLTWADVDYPAQLLRVHGARKNLAAPWREVPLRDDLLPLLHRWQADGVQWLVHYKGAPVKSIKRAWAGMLSRAGIARAIRPYDLRHRYATDLLAAGVDVGTVARLLGHASPVMLLEHYQYVMDRQKRAAADALPPLPRVTSLCNQRREAGEKGKTGARKTAG